MLIAVVTLGSLFGCGGGSNATPNPFAGGRSFNYFNTNDPKTGVIEVVVRPNGSFEPNGAVYSYEYNGSDFIYDQGDVTSGQIDTGGNFVIEAIVNKEGYPPTDKLEPYAFVAKGRAIARGAHYEGTMTVAYYDWSPATGRAETPRTELSFNLFVHKVDRSKLVKR